MPRRRCCGLIDELPVCNRFLPEEAANGPGVVLKLEELEAIRLKDLRKLEQTECADAMNLSRPTFQRILQSARTKLAVALIEGRAIIIEGGNYIMKNRTFECTACHHVWEEKPCTEGGKHGYEIACPNCGGMQKMKVENGQKHACGGHSQHDHGHSNGHGCCGKR